MHRDGAQRLEEGGTGPSDSSPSSALAIPTCIRLSVVTLECPGLSPSDQSRPPTTPSYPPHTTNLPSYTKHTAPHIHTPAHTAWSHTDYSAVLTPAACRCASQPALRDAGCQSGVFTPRKPAQATEQARLQSRLPYTLQSTFTPCVCAHTHTDSHPPIHTPHHIHTQPEFPFRNIPRDHEAQPPSTSRTPLHQTLQLTTSPPIRPPWRAQCPAPRREFSTVHFVSGKARAPESARPPFPQSGL